MYLFKKSDGALTFNQIILAFVLLIVLVGQVSTSPHHDDISPVADSSTEIEIGQEIENGGTLIKRARGCVVTISKRGVRMNRRCFVI